jgi:hypothetical protein
VQNPWLELRPERPYILEMDRESVNGYNASRRTERTRLNLNSVPEPFIGNPQLATVVLLSLNPGDVPADWESHSDAGFKEAMSRNLRQEPQKCPFYPLNPTFSRTGAGQWWRPRILELQREAGLDDEALAERLLVIEWFPYHSKKSGISTKPVCESQKYSVQLAREMLRKRKLVVGMRSMKHWLQVLDPRGGRAVEFLNNPQCGYISRGNTSGDLSDRIVRALT